MAGDQPQAPDLVRSGPAPRPVGDDDATEIDLPPYFDDLPPRMPSLVLDTRSAEDVWKASDDVAARRKRFARIVAGVVGVAWAVCQLACARTLASTVVSALEDDGPIPTPMQQTATVAARR